MEKGNEAEIVLKIMRLTDSIFTSTPQEAPMPFFFRIIAKNSKCDELPEVALRRSPTTTLPNVADESHTKKKSVSFKEEVESIDAKPESNNKASDILNKASQENLKRPSTYPPNEPRIETIKLKLDASNNNVSIIKNTNDSSTPKFESKHKKKEKKNKHESPLPKYSIESKKSHLKESKKDEYEFDDGIEEQKLNFLNKFQLTAKKILNAKNDSSFSLTNNKKDLSQKQTENNNINKRKSKEPVKSIPKKYKFHEMKSVSQGNKFLFTKSGVGHEITFDMSPKPLGSKPSLSKVKSDIMLAQQRADAKVHKAASVEVKAAPVEHQQPEKLANSIQRNVPIKPKKLPLLLPKQPSPVVSPSVAPSATSPTAFVIKKPEMKKDFKSSEISVTKINEQNHHLRVYGPKPKSPVQKSQVTESAAPQFKSPDGFAQPLPPKVKSNALPPPPTQILKPYGYPMKMPKNIPENMQTPYGCRTPFYVPSSPSYTPNFDPKPQFKYANPNAYASFMQTMFCAPNNAGKVSPPINSMSSPKAPTDNSRKRASSDNNSSVPLKRKSPSPSKNTETGSKAISILNQINFPSSLSVTLTNEQEENKKEQLRSQKQSVVNNNIEIIKISEEKESKPNSQQARSSNTSPVDLKNSETRKSLPGLVPNLNPMLGPNPILPPPVAKALAESKESFQRAFLESLSSLAGKQSGEKPTEKFSPGRKKESGKPNATETAAKDDKDKLITEIKTEENVNCDQNVSQVPKNSSRNSDALQASARKNVSLTPPPLRSVNKPAVNSSKALTPPPFIQDPSVFSANAAQAMQFNLMLLNAAAKSPHLFSDYASIQQTMLLESLRQNAAIRHQIQQQQQVQKNPSSSHSPSSASSPSSKH